MSDNEYEQERKRTIAENRALLGSLGLDGGAAKAMPALVESKPQRTPRAARAKRKLEVKVEDAPRRRSARVAGIEADGPALKALAEQEEREREAARVVNRKFREQVMRVADMVEDTPEPMVPELEKYLAEVGEKKNARVYPPSTTTAKEAYADKEGAPAEVERLKDAFSNMALYANTKVTSERVFSMVVHPEKTKTLVLVGDKYGQLGIWDAMGPPPEPADGDEDDYGTGRIWNVQAHARNSISCMKIDPAAGSSLITSSYDCSLRQLDFTTCTSTELFAFDDEDMLITHFDLVPGGQQAWIVDKNGGISHCDFRGRARERRRWVVQDEGRAAKLGGISVNPIMPHLICTASNDQHLRIWDVRHLSKLAPEASEMLDPPEGKADRLATHPTSSIGYERTSAYLKSAKGKGLLRASFQHGKSCSAAYWDPFGRRILSTSYDDRLRVWTLNPQSFMLDSPLPPTHFRPSTVVPHDCQTGRWLTILRAQWSLNTEYFPHFTVGNMKRRLDIVAATGDKIASLWADGVTAVPAVTASHPSRVNCVVGGNTSGRIQLWMPAEDE